MLQSINRKLITFKCRHRIWILGGHVLVVSALAAVAVRIAIAAVIISLFIFIVFSRRLRFIGCAIVSSQVFAWLPRPFVQVTN